MMSFLRATGWGKSTTQVASFVFLATFSQASFAQTAREVPEPMVFDLVRGLDPSAGELEVNALALYSPRDPTLVEWAPEVEWAPVRGLALELEVPMQNIHPEAIKAAIQGSLPVPDGGQVGHGIQLLAEYEWDHQELFVTPLYLLALNLSSHWSAMIMAGPLVVFPLDGEGGPSDDKPQGGPIDDVQDHANITPGAIFNATLFYRVSPKVVVGSEQDLQFFGGSPFFRWMPQVHGDLTKHLSVQGGAGLTISSEKKNLVDPELGLRVIYSR